MSNGTLGTPAGNEHSLSKAQIYDLIKQRVPYSEICARTGFTKGYISQIKREFKEREDMGIGKIFYIEYKDHMVVDNANGFHEPPILVCIGQLVRETCDAFHILQIWNKSLNKEIRYNIVLKADITKKIRLVFSE